MSRRFRSAAHRGIYEADTASIDASLSDFAPSEASLHSSSSSLDKKERHAHAATSDFRLPNPLSSAQRLDLDTSTRTSKTLRPLPARASSSKTHQKVNTSSPAPSRKNSGHRHVRSIDSDNTNTSEETDLLSCSTADDSFGPATQSFDKDTSPHPQMASTSDFHYTDAESDAEGLHNLLWSPPVNKFSPMPLPAEFASPASPVMRRADKSQTGKSSIATEMTATPTRRPLFQSRDTTDTAIRVTSKKDVADDADTTPTKKTLTPPGSGPRRTMKVAKNWFKGQPYAEMSITASEASDTEARISEQESRDDTETRSVRSSSSRSQRGSSHEDDEEDEVEGLTEEDIIFNEEELAREDLMAAVRAPLPPSMSPCKETPSSSLSEGTRSPSPIKREVGSPSPEEMFSGRSHSPERRGSPAKMRSASPLKQPPTPHTATRVSREKSVKTEQDESDTPSDNYIRFSVRADVMQRTKPIEQFVNWARTFKLAPSAPSSRWVWLMIFITGFIVMIMNPLSPPPPPDISVLSTFALSFEPAIYYSETGVSQVQNVQNTRLAVWDLGESIRLRNIPNSSPLVEEISNIERSLKSYTHELSRFFAEVDGDIDLILYTLDWARLSLTRVAKVEPGIFSTFISRVDDALFRFGLAAPSYTTNLSEFSLSTLLGPSSIQRTRRATNLAFVRLFAVLETSVRHELARTANLLGYLNAIDHSLVNLRSMTGSLLSEQEREESEILSSLWRRALGKAKHLLTKYEGNRALLSALKQHTVSSKRLLLEHNSKLLMLQSSLDVLEHKFASPSMRAAIRDTVLEMEEIDAVALEIELPPELGANVRAYVARVSASASAATTTATPIAVTNADDGKGTSSEKVKRKDPAADEPERGSATESLLGSEQNIFDDLLAMYDIWEQIDKVSKTHSYLSGLRGVQRRKVMDSFFAPEANGASESGSEQGRLKIDGR